MAELMNVKPPVTTSHDNSLVTISLGLECPAESLTITVSVQNDGGEQDIYALSLARARDFARRFLELSSAAPTHIFANSLHQR
jgi:hypothetical protein